MPIPFKTAKRRGIFCLNKEEKSNVEKERLEKTLKRKQLKEEVFNHMLKEQNEIRSKIEMKLTELKKKIKEDQDMMVSEKPRESNS